MEYSSDKIWCNNTKSSLEDITQKFLQLEVNNEIKACCAQDSYYRTQPPSPQPCMSSFGEVISRPQVGPKINDENNDLACQQKLSIIRAMIGERASTQDGSEFLLKAMAQSQKCKDLIFGAVFENLFGYMVHEFGSNVFAKLLEFCNDDQLQMIADELAINRDLFITTICNRYGANSVKRLIKVVEESPLISTITTLLAKDFNMLMRNRTSSNVILKCLQCLNARQNKELFEASLRDCIELATDERGCIALNESMSLFKQPYRDQILEKISSQAHFLSQDPSGNYVLQVVLELSHPYFTKKICNLLNGSFVKLATQKSSSRVVEKCLLNNVGKDMILEEFINYDQLYKIARDQNGNYVIQKALDKAKESVHYHAFVEKLYKDKHYFEFSHGKHVYKKLMDIASLYHTNPSYF